MTDEDDDGDAQVFRGKITRAKNLSLGDMPVGGKGSWHWVSFDAFAGKHYKIPDVRIFDTQQDAALSALT